MLVKTEITANVFPALVNFFFRLPALFFGGMIQIFATPFLSFN